MVKSCTTFAQNKMLIALKLDTLWSATSWRVAASLATKASQPVKKEIQKYSVGFFDFFFVTWLPFGKVVSSGCNTKRVTVHVFCHFDAK